MKNEFRVGENVIAEDDSCRKFLGVVVSVKDEDDPCYLVELKDGVGKGTFFESELTKANGPGKMTRVTSEALPNGYYRYHAHFENSDPVVIRKKATRLYENAFYYSDKSGNGSGLLVHFTFGKKPASYRKLLRAFPIVMNKDDSETMESDVCSMKMKSGISDRLSRLIMDKDRETPAWLMDKIMSGCRAYINSPGKNLITINTGQMQNYWG
jgi:hypothetical protein